jgi:hypothetical protein
LVQSFCTTYFQYKRISVVSKELFLPQLIRGTIALYISAHWGHTRTPAVFSSKVVLSKDAYGTLNIIGIGPKC